jgi:hypothetical protein
MSEHWSTEGRQVTAETLESLEGMIDDETDLVIDHRFYRGARAPFRFVAQSYEALRTYLREQSKPRRCPGDLEVEERLHG